MRVFRSKAPGETVDFSLDFSGRLDDGESLALVQSIALGPYHCLDADTVGMLTGPGKIVSAEVVVRLQNGIAGNTYRIEATCSTSNGRLVDAGGRFAVEEFWLR